MKIHLNMSSAKWRPFCPGGGGGGWVSLTTTKLWVWVNNYIQLTQWDVHAWPYMNVNGKLSWGSYWCNRFTSPYLNTLRPRQNGRHFLDDTIKRIFLNENIRISIEISLKFVPKGPINEIPALVQIMAWRRPGDKPLSELMMVNLPKHICVSRPQWFNLRFFCYSEWTTWDLFHLHGLTLIPAWISNHMSSKVWDEITYPLPNFNGGTVNKRGQWYFPVEIKAWTLPRWPFGKARPTGVHYWTVA